MYLQTLPRLLLENFSAEEAGVGALALVDVVRLGHLIQLLHQGIVAKVVVSEHVLLHVDVLLLEGGADEALESRARLASHPDGHAAHVVGDALGERGSRGAEICGKGDARGCLAGVFRCCQKCC